MRKIYNPLKVLKSISAILFLIHLNIPAQAQEINEDTIFNQWDKNKDGKLQLEELPPNARPNFKKADQNNDGTISRVEDGIFRSKLRKNRRINREENPQFNKNLIKIESNIFYTKNKNPRQSLDLIIPIKRASKKLPVIVYIHGGAWKSGNKEQGLRHLTPYVESGNYIGASIGYRLSSESKWPNQIYDCKAAIRWIRGNAKKYGIDAEKIGAMGHSAGGHLVSMLGTSSSIKALEGSLGEYKKHPSNVNCVVNFFGPSAFLEMSKFPSTIDHNSAQSPESQLIGGALNENEKNAKLASPIHYVSKDDVPFMHIHGTNDQLVPYNQSVIFNKKLLQAGCESVLITVKEGGHGGFKNEKIKILTDKFFDKHLRNSNFEIKEQTIKQFNSSN
jgi:acetyl esterase/lipase